ncbi:LytR/AlgR family response regulator transcription factor [Fulvivirga lutea]|uniref:Response regulator n=1 Tax=Fulvivirga lutea TaxID=2810512 RepID=A0A974WII4_9BACT|nr:response regulator [Fulvivirga lutea]QSE98790.1 response regulator [Fulvivirga lutea]
MSKVRVFIVEDDFIHANRLEMYLEEMGYELAGLVANAEEAINLIAATKPDLLLVDIHLEGNRDGVQMVEQLNKKNPIPAIFITSFRDKETFDRAKLTDPYAYIIKPYDKDMLQAAIELAVYKFSKTSKHLDTIHTQTDYQGWNEDQLVNDTMYVKSNGSLVKIKLSDILCVEAKDKICQIGLIKESIDTRISLQKLEEQLISDRFLRVHRSFIINKEAISQVNLSESKVSVGQYAVPIGRSYKASFLNSLGQLPD